MLLIQKVYSQSERRTHGVVKKQSKNKKNSKPAKGQPLYSEGIL